MACFIIESIHCPSYYLAGNDNLKCKVYFTLSELYIELGDNMIVNRLRELREAKRTESNSPELWTQEGLAKRLGVTRQTIISMEKGKYNPSLTLAFKLANLFDVKIEDIFEYRDD